MNVASRICPTVLRRALVAVGACAFLFSALFSATGCACRCAGGSGTEARSLAFTLDSVGARFCEDAKSTADSIVGIPCALQRHLDDCSQSLCETQQLMGGCHSKLDR